MKVPPDALVMLRASSDEQVFRALCEAWAAGHGWTDGDLSDDLRQRMFQEVGAVLLVHHEELGEQSASLDREQALDAALEVVPADDATDPRFVAAVDLVGRMGAQSFQIRYDDDPEPTVWTAVAEWEGIGYECAGGMTPLRAVLRLLDVLVNGRGACAHCGRPAFVSDDWEADPGSLDVEACWYVFDPETAKFRRSCEGDTKGRRFTLYKGKMYGRNDPCPCGSGQKYKRCHGA